MGLWGLRSRRRLCWLRSLCKARGGTETFRVIFLCCVPIFVRCGGYSKHGVCVFVVIAWGSVGIWFCAVCFVAVFTLCVCFSGRGHS